MATKNPIFTSVISGSPTITSEKLIGSENYLSWSASVELWFMGQGYEDHLVTPEDAIPDVDKVQWKKIDAQLCSQDMDLSTYIGRIASLKEEFLTLMPFTNGAEAQQIQTDKFFMVLTLIGLRPDLESVRDQILASPSVPSLDDVFARLLRLSSTQTLSTDGPSDSSVLASQTNSRGGRSGNRGRGQRPQCTYCNKLGHTRDRCYQLHGRPPRTAHIAQSSDPLLSRPDSAASSTSQSITLTGSDYDAYLRYQAATSAYVASVAPPRTEYGEDDWHRARLGHPSLSKFQKMVPRFSTLSSLACESCQLGNILVTSSPPRLRNASSWDTLDFRRLSLLFPDTHRYFLSADVTFFEDSPFFSSSESLPISEVLPLPYISPLQMRSLVLFRFIIVDIVLLLLLSSAEVPDDSPPVPPISPTSTLSSTDHLPIALWKALVDTFSSWVATAMVDEMAALHSNGTWDLVSLPPGKSTVGCRWVYTVKVGPDGQVDRLKARLVAKAMCHWPLYQLDIKNAFLHGELLEEVYMEQPPGFVAQGESGLVCKLRRSLYGLKQSPRHGSDQEGIQRLKQHLFNHFQTKDLGKLKYFLGLEIAQSSSGVVMSQRKYALDILEETGEPLRDPGRYRRLVGKLNYLTITRSDIYFPEQPGQGMLYEDRGHTQIVGYTNANWAGSPSDRCSTLGYCVFIGGQWIRMRPLDCLFGVLNDSCPAGVCPVDWCSINWCALISVLRWE
ncbi:Retrovirus-related Pol polyprotein from transposon RE1 [Vitis vinifera]|uniref:Retrovirus-related Pol polyprotein from transposon RE1 n=1 Tax=Vitis vinifera TaxID=29760 RepID=A0A438HIX2_VITVI|nr:Retrovirus-related Pol polyprotein from transposon RE1 [Vitis vinifera]